MLKFIIALPVMLILLLASCVLTLNYKKIPANYRGDKTLPKKPLYVKKGDVKFLPNSCVVVSTAVMERVLDPEMSKLEQLEYEKLAKELLWTEQGTPIISEFDYFNKKDMSAPYEMYEMDSCYAYSYTAEKILNGCSAALYFRPKAGGINHVETVLGVDVLDDKTCTFYTDSWGSYGTITGFSESTVKHDKYLKYSNSTTQLYAFYVCPVK